MPLILAVIALFMAWNWWHGDDEDFIPRRLSGMSAYVYNAETGQELFAGIATGKYWDRDQLLSSCANHAISMARSVGMRDWSYVCCTITPDSACHTKVR